MKGITNKSSQFTLQAGIRQYQVLENIYANFRAADTSSVIFYLWEGVNQDYRMSSRVLC
jgi:hypothetical protein